jgi:hypothetical protein
LNEAVISPEGELIGMDDSLVELSDKELDRYFKGILDKYGVEDGRIIGFNQKEYWLPLAAKEDLDILGILWYKIEQATNPEHPDYGKKFVVVDFNDVKNIDETKDVYAMYKKAGMEAPHPGKGIHTKKFHKCVTSVGDKGGKNPYAICMSSLGKNKAVKASHRTDEGMEKR